MRIGIVSDTHGRNHNVLKALDLLRQHGVTTVIHCGDIEDPETIPLFAGLTAHFVFGNCDWNHEPLRRAVAAAGATLHEPFGHLELAGKKLAFLHGHDHALKHDVENSGHFDFLFYGHTHQVKEHQTGPTRVINPGALHRANPKTFIILDLATDRVELLAI